MRRAVITFFLLLYPAAAYADGGVGAFQSGAWQGAPAMDADAFSACEMTTFFKGDAGPPIRLKVALGPANDESISLYSERFSFKMQTIRSGISFDGEPPAGVQGDVISPKELVLDLADTDVLNRHPDAKKLTLIFSDASIDFDLGVFSAAMTALRQCVEVNKSSTPSIASTPPIAAAVAQPVQMLGAAESAVPKLVLTAIAPAFALLTGILLALAAILYVAFEISLMTARRRYRAEWLEMTASLPAEPAPSVRAGQISRL